MISSGVIVKVIYETKLDPDKPYIYCPNHTSYLDVPLLRVVLPGYYHYMGKVELLKNFFFGIFFRTMDIPVDRSSIMSAHRAFVRAGEDLDKGVGVVMFPEGSITDDVPNLSEFKPGPFRLAIKHNVPIVPITIIDNWKIMPDNKPLQGRPGVSRIIVHEPIDCTEFGKDDIERLSDMVYNKLNDTLKRYGN
ncbi:MAG: 1-acyl-sn-glycerol-3-phosphate acyltransferase [Bacteroidetes bacterium]|nr:1-acyl-sn-glycerol-3-phosphate acyltransferase [Bacteroidia bacterium]PCH69993.1 MAG: 1-acyl-sn-glycerol-3-phosphate acyltransferase [Bacteroidota bacterium]